MCYHVVTLYRLQHGLYDEDFLNAPKPTFGIQTIESAIQRLQDRQVEAKAADQMTKLVSPDVPGRKPGEKGLILLLNCNNNVPVSVVVVVSACFCSGCLWCRVDCG